MGGGWGGRVAGKRFGMLGLGGIGIIFKSCDRGFEGRRAVFGMGSSGVVVTVTRDMAKIYLAKVCVHPSSRDTQVHFSGLLCRQFGHFWAFVLRLQYREFLARPDGR